MHAPQGPMLRGTGLLTHALCFPPSKSDCLDLVIPPPYSYLRQACVTSDFTTCTQPQTVLYISRRHLQGPKNIFVTDLSCCLLPLIRVNQPSSHSKTRNHTRNRVYRTTCRKYCEPSPRKNRTQFPLCPWRVPLTQPLSSLHWPIRATWRQE